MGDVMDETSKSAPAKPPGISRREFARRAALASAVATVVPASALSSPSSPLNDHAPVAAADFGVCLSGPSSEIAAPEQQPTDLPKLSPESHAEAEARIQTILSQYGGRFNDTQKADLRRLCFLAQPPLDRLRAYALENGDGPALYLKPLVEREKNPLENTRVGKTPAARGNP
jgi:hypothetical protein